MCVGMFAAILDIQVVAASLPAIQQALEIRPDQMSWIQTAYLIAEIVAIPLTGFLTRRLGMRRLFALGLGMFTLASAGCAASNGFAPLIACRVLQGFSGGTLIPSVFSAVFLLFPRERQDLATTLGGVLAVLAPTVGPVVGGWITHAYSWHWLFLINLLPGIVCVAAGWFLLPREEMRPEHKIDAVSLLLMAMALASLEIGLKQAPHEGWISLPMLVALAAGAGFIWQSLRAAHAVVELRNFTDYNFAIGCALSFLLGIGLFGSVYLMPLFLALVRGHNSLRIGQIMLVTGLAQLASAPLAAKLDKHCDARPLAAFGFALFAAGSWLSVRQTPAADFADMLWPQILRGFAIMFCLLPPTRIALGLLEKARVPDASGLFNLMRNLGGAIGLALIDTVIFGRAESNAGTLVERLKAGDTAAAEFVGIPLDQFLAKHGQPLDSMTEAILRAMIEKAALTQAVGSAWLMIAGVMLAALMVIPFALSESSSRIRPRRRYRADGR